MAITLVTTTRDRALCFGLLQKWIARQTLKPDQWLVVNDGEEAYSYTMNQTVLKRNPSEDELPSICENWLAALNLIHGNKVVVAEDDDWLHPTYLETISALLDEVDVAGVREDFYFKLPIRKFLRMRNTGHASLGATAFRPSAFPLVERACRIHRSIYIDMYLWAESTQEGSGLLCGLLPNEAEDGRALHVGMKMMPGAKGLGMGHSHDGTADPLFRELTRQIGAEDVRVYQALKT